MGLVPRATLNADPAHTPAPGPRPSRLAPLLPASPVRYTQYIPLSIYELQAWLGTPAIYVLDCSAAGFIINRCSQHSC